jgi:glucokinase
VPADISAPVAAGAALGVDVGGSAVKWALVVDGSVVDGGSTPTPPGDAAAGLDVVAELVAAQQCELVGVGLPGPVTPGLERLYVPNLGDAWTASAIRERIAAVSSARVALVNDAHACTLAEARLGAGRGVDDLVCLTLGTGVGGGIALGGRLHRGALGRAGEIGHMSVDPSGARCACGNRGCLETIASGPAIVSAAERPLRQGAKTPLRALTEGDPERLTPALVATAAEAGDPFAADVLTRAGQAVGIALASVSAMLAPQLAVIGGGVAAALEAMRPGIEEMLARRGRLLEPMPVVAAALGPRSGAIGAAEWALSEARA